MIKFWRNTFTRRWHMNADMAVHYDCNGGHQGRCAIMLLKLFPDHSHNLLKSCLTHDMAEAYVGDLSRPFKQAGGKLVCDHKDLEEELLDKDGFNFPLTEREKKILTLLDYLDSWLYAMHKAPYLINKKDWSEDRASIYSRSVSLGVAVQVGTMMKEVFN